MIAIKFEDCNGCGDCVECCPTGALLLQNGKAWVDQNLCEGCEACVDSCPQSAIIHQDAAPIGVAVTRVPMETTLVRSPSIETRDVSIREALLPAVYSFLIWTGREIAPRLANLFVNYLDRRMQNPDPGSNFETVQYANRRSGGRGKHRRARRRRQGKK